MAEYHNNIKKGLLKIIQANNYSNIMTNIRLATLNKQIPLQRYLSISQKNRKILPLRKLINILSSQNNIFNSGIILPVSFQNMMDGKPIFCDLLPIPQYGLGQHVCQYHCIVKTSANLSLSQEVSTQMACNPGARPSQYLPNSQGRHFIIIFTLIQQCQPTVKRNS